MTKRGNRLSRSGELVSQKIVSFLSENLGRGMLNVIQHY